MQFNEPTFLLLFLPVLLLAYYLFKPLRNVLLVLASLLYCFWGAKQTIWILAVALIFNYISGILLGRFRERALVGIAVGVNLLLLVWCKYAAFLKLPLPHLPQPPGLSFFTFVAIAYVVDVYKGQAQPITSPVGAVNYFLFFSKFFAGPIVRYRDLGSQLARREHSQERFADGVRRFIVGLGKKVLIANTVATVADNIFGLPAAALRLDLAWLGVLAYTVQIYFDFSGYTDMAIGLGAMFGFTFPENFNYPYVSTSIREFWRRWHMTLSSWLRDYLYIPLGGSRCPPWRTYFNLILVFFLCGLWHGANWTFIVWGSLQGVFLLLERLVADKTLEKSPRLVGHVYALLVTMVSWVFFRATSLPQAANFLSAMVGLNHPTLVADSPRALLDPFTFLAFLAGIIGAFPVVPAMQARLKAREAWATAALTCILAVVLVLVAVKTYAPTIYQKF